MKLAQIAETLGARLENGSPDLEITGVAGIKEAVPGQLSFVANPKYAGAARTTKASAVIVSDEFPAISTALLRSKNPYLTFARALDLFWQPPRYEPGVHPTAVVHPSAVIGQGAHIGPYVVIDQDVEIGSHAVLLAHVVIYRGASIGDDFFAHAHAVVREGCRLGNHVLLQNGAVIGADGFGFAKDDSGHWFKIAQPEPVILEDEVEVQANSCVDRASVEKTRIGRGTKIDNLVQVGHGSRIGEHSLLASQVGLAGSTEVGNHVILTGQVGVVGHCKIGDGAIVTPQSGVAGDIEAGAIVSGAPAVDHKLWLKYSAVLPRLPEIARAVRKGNKE
ncbi:MAG TPA: UDP-3-O-(3-hydroxymyristoyl)glucosamine N-acyltransferase [Terriglobales bacterium]|jgi:UDP-3-O-[3-hydroxymyristoyl] glucosamine N-acyltransferase|nr:UDP-3-O-(3-hydroxymyristoyl)glucosamine N-acyltransferase [Terriglobales bacterium]HMJ22825.1 UDP-3-O-(3-hydroxymyristoyl)glucosamine N-acyltransferase [Terriglobales bacterium]